MDRPKDPPSSVEDIDEQVALRLESWVQRPPLTLFFDADLERFFAAERLERYIPVARFSLALAVLLYTVFVVVDALTFRQYQTPLLLGLLVGVAVPSCLIALWVSFRRSRLRWYEAVAVGSLLANGVSLALVINIGRHQGLEPPPQMLLLQLWYVFFLLGVRCVVALPVTLVIALTYSSGMVLADLDAYRIYEDSYLYLAAVFLGAIASRLLEFSERRSWLQERVLRRLSERDALTGLLNHRVFFERAEACLRHARREGRTVALAVIDVDHFKAYNDTCGHLQGDECLRRIATALRASARRGLDLAARIGGEEFAVLWYGVDEAWTRRRAESLRMDIQRLHLPHPGNDSGRVTVSIGITCRLPDQDASADNLVNAADRALYQAKSLGRNGVCASWEAETAARD